MTDSNPDNLVLNIDLTVEYKLMNIGGHICRLATEEDLGIRGTLRLQRITNRFAGLSSDETIANLSDDDIDVLSQQLKEAVESVVLDAPEGLLDRLNDVHRLRILTAFSEAVIEGKPQEKTEPSTTAVQSISARSSRGSKGSTAARRRAG